MNPIAPTHLLERSWDFLTAHNWAYDRMRTIAGLTELSPIASSLISPVISSY